MNNFQPCLYEEPNMQLKETQIKVALCFIFVERGEIGPHNRFIKNTIHEGGK